MNKAKRASLTGAQACLSQASGIISDVRYAEQDALNNMPENLENGDRYRNMEDAIDHLEDALDDINRAKSSIDAAMG